MTVRSKFSSFYCCTDVFDTELLFDVISWLTSSPTPIPLSPSRDVPLGSCQVWRQSDDLFWTLNPENAKISAMWCHFRFGNVMFDTPMSLPRLPSRLTPSLVAIRQIFGCKTLKAQRVCPCDVTSGLVTSSPIPLCQPWGAPLGSCQVWWWLDDSFGCKPLKTQRVWPCDVTSGLVTSSLILLCLFRSSGLPSRLMPSLVTIRQFVQTQNPKTELALWRHFRFGDVIIDTHISPPGLPSKLMLSLVAIKQFFWTQNPENTKGLALWRHFQFSDVIVNTPMCLSGLGAPV